MKKRQTNNYTQLRKIWYAKLAKSGFEDIEQDENNLKEWSSRIINKQYIDPLQTDAEYYYLATNFLNTYGFESERERIIWEYHANAISCRDIAKLLRKVRIKTTKTAVWLVIKRLRSVMRTNIYERKNE